MFLLLYLELLVIWAMGFLIGKLPSGNWMKGKMPSPKTLVLRDDFPFQKTSRSVGIGAVLSGCSRF